MGRMILDKTTNNGSTELEKRENKKDDDKSEVKADIGAKRIGQGKDETKRGRRIMHRFLRSDIAFVGCVCV